MHWYQVGDEISPCECQCSRARLPPSRYAFLSIFLSWLHSRCMILQIALMNSSLKCHGRFGLTGLEIIMHIDTNFSMLYKVTVVKNITSLHLFLYQMNDTILYFSLQGPERASFG